MQQQAVRVGVRRVELRKRLAEILGPPPSWGGSRAIQRKERCGG